MGDIMLLPSDAGDSMEVTIFDGDEPIESVSLIDLVDEWVELESIDGALHPYMDGTLNVISDMTFALLNVIRAMEEDDPHREALLDLYSEGYRYAQALVDALNDERGTKQ